LSKPTVALVVPGGVGSGYYEDGIPLLLRFCKAIGERCTLHVFSLTHTKDDFVPPNYTLHSIETEHYHSLVKKHRLFMTLFYKEHKKHSFDLVQGIWTSPSGLMAVLAARNFGIKSLVSLQGGGLADIKSLKYGGNQGFFKKRLNNWILKQASWISAETNFQANLLLDKKHHHKLKVIHYGIQTEDFPETEISANEDSIEFIHIANINVVKNQELLIETFNELRKEFDCTLRIIGPDFYDGKIQAMVEERNLDSLVSFDGHQPFSAVQEALKSAHVLLHTSHFESTAMAVIEAMASKVLVCATDVGIVHDLGEDYFLIDRSSEPKQFAQAITTLLENKSAVKDKIEKSFEWTRVNTLSQTADQFSNYYESILS